MFFFLGSMYYLVLGPVSQSNALYDMALLQGFGSVYSWLTGPCMLKGHPGYLLVVNAE